MESNDETYRLLRSLLANYGAGSSLLTYGLCCLEKTAHENLFRYDKNEKKKFIIGGEDGDFRFDDGNSFLKHCPDDLNVDFDHRNSEYVRALNAVLNPSVRMLTATEDKFDFTNRDPNLLIRTQGNGNIQAKTYVGAETEIILDSILASFGHDTRNIFTGDYNIRCQYRWYETFHTIADSEHGDISFAPDERHANGRNIEQIDLVESWKQSYFRDKEPGDTLGLKWRKYTGPEPPEEKTLSNEALSEALKTKHQFTSEEWRQFNVKNLKEDNFIEAGGGILSTGG